MTTCHRDVADFMHVMYNITARKKDFNLFFAGKIVSFKGINNNKHLRSYVYFLVDNSKDI